MQVILPDGVVGEKPEKKASKWEIFNACSKERVGLPLAPWSRWKNVQERSNKTVDTLHAQQRGYGLSECRK